MKKIKFDDITILDYQQLVRLYHKETPRAAAILAGSYVEYFLGKYLKSFMRKNVDEKKLFEGFGPFSTFAQRISTAYAFNLIAKQEKDDLNTIKEIRNYFAHHPRKMTFRNKEIKKLCDKLSLAKSVYDPIKKKKKTFSSRELYLFTIGLFVGSAHNVMPKNNTIKTHDKSIHRTVARR